MLIIKTINLFFVLFLTLFFSCDDKNAENPAGSENNNTDEIHFQPIDDLNIGLFTSSSECQSCHPVHYEQWQNSSHHFSINDPKFFSDWYEEQQARPESGTHFCSQCHIPVAFQIDSDLINGFDNPLTYNSDSNIPDVLKEGIGCEFCHSMVEFPPKRIDTGSPPEPTVEFPLYPGQGYQFGSITNPVDNEYHKSEYLSIYEDSRMCASCHNHYINDKQIETTFAEWESDPANAMFNLNSCQSCHMQSSIGQAAVGGPDDRTIHNHNFVGVNTDLTQSYGSGDPIYDDVRDLLSESVEIEFEISNDESVELVWSNNNLTIPITITNLAAHNIPTGNAFVRESWLELIVYDSEQNIIQSFGKVSDNEVLDVNILPFYFTVELLDENQDTIFTASVAQDYHRTVLPTFGSVYDVIELDTEGWSQDIEDIIITARMLFRSYKPILLQSHPEMLENLKIFEMDSIGTSLSISK